MVSKKTSIEALYTVTKADPKIEDMKALEEEIYASGSDRTTAIMFGSFTDENLRRLIDSALSKDLSSDERKGFFRFEGIAGSFGSRIVIARAFNMIGPSVRSDLDLIRIIRNGFAHSRVSFSFRTKEVSNVCKHFSIVDLDGVFIPFRYLESLSPPEREAADDISNPKTRFITSCHVISYRMHQRVHGPVAGDVAFRGELLP